MHKILLLLISLLIFWGCKSPVEEDDTAEFSSIEEFSSEEERPSSSSEEESSSSEEEPNSSSEEEESSSSEEEPNSSSEEEESSSSEEEPSSSSEEEDSSSSEEERPSSSSEKESSSSEEEIPGSSSEQQDSSSSALSSSSDSVTECEHEINSVEKGWLDYIRCPEDLSLVDVGKYMGDWREPNNGIVQSVNLVYEFKKKLLYFVDGSKYELHSEFCRDVLGWEGESNDYYIEQYVNGPDRIYLQGELTEYIRPDPDIYVLEIPIGNNEMTAEQMIEFYRVVQEHVKLAKIHFWPHNKEHIEMAEMIKDSISVIDSSAVE